MTSTCATPENLQTFTPVTRYFRIKRQDIVFLKFIQEAYEGLATLSTFDQGRGIIRITWQENVTSDLEGLLGGLAADIELSEIAETDLMKGTP